MQGKRKLNEPGSTRWLWWLATLIAGIGALLVYMIRDHDFGAQAEQRMMAVIMITIVGCGICIISATSKLWLRR